MNLQGTLSISRKCLQWLFAACCLLATSLAANAGNPPSENMFTGFVPDVNKCYKIVNKSTGKCKHVKDASMNDGASSVQWDYQGNDNQKWKFQDAGGGYYNMICVHSNKCLDIEGASYNNGAYAIQWQPNGNDNQKFRFDDAGSGYSYIVAKHSGKALKLENEPGSNGTKIIQKYISSWFTDQKWQFVEVPCPVNPPSGGGCSSSGQDVLVHWKMDACGSPYSSYSEFTPTYPQAGGCSAVNATGVFRTSGDHSCVSGANSSTAGMCVGTSTSCTFTSNSSQAVRFEVTVTPNSGGTASLGKLTFYEKAPSWFQQLNGNSGYNNYPTKFGIRVTKNGSEVFKQTGISTSQSWRLESIDFSSDPDFTVNSATTFKFELLGYCKVGNGASATLWDVDEIKVHGCCSTPPPPCNINLAVSDILCDGKGTSSTSDDTYTFKITATGTGTSNAWTGSFNHACLGVFQIGNTAYGTPVTLGPFPAGQYSCGNTSPPITYQNGLDINVSVQDAQNSSCSKNATVLSPGPCSPTAGASLGDFVWNDLDKDGSQDAGEPGVSGVTVKLYKCDNTFVAQTTTNAQGIYSFTNLASNMQYYVEFTLPSGFTFSSKDAAADNIDSDANTSSGKTDCTFLSPGENDNSIDAGISQVTPNASVGDFVWNDLDKDGVQDPGEPGVQGVVVKLFKCDNTFIGQFTTNANGGYQFVNLAVGSYYLTFSNLPAGYQFSPKDAGGDDSKDSDADVATGKTDCFNLAAGQNDPTRDAGINQPTGTGPGSVGDFVWFDTNANGIQDAGEPGVSGIFVILETCAGQFVNFATTNAQGAYLITNVQPGSYRVKFASPGSINGSPVQFTLKDAGGDDSKDSDADNLGFTACFTLAAGENKLTLDAGFTGQAPPQVCTINGTVSNVVCNANGTVSFTLVVNGSFTGEWGYDIPALNQYTLQYGQPYNFTIPGSATPTTLQLNDHDVAGCTTTVTITSPAPCNTGGGTPTGCDGITFTGGSGKITIAGFSAPIVLIKVFNAAWQTVFECNSNCVNPTVVNNLPAGSYFVNVQLFNANWSLICKKEGYVNVTSFNGGGGGNEMVVNPGDGSEPFQPAAPDLGASVSGRTGGDASSEIAQPTILDIFPNPAQGYAIVNWGEVADWQQAELTLLNQLGQAVQKVTLDNAGEGNYMLDLDGLKGGQYVVRFRADEAAPIVKKLIISK